MVAPQVPVAREGYPFIGFAAFATVVAALVGHELLAWGGVAVTGFVLFFFRDPERVGPEAVDALVAPADGQVIAIDQLYDERYLGDHAYRVSIFMNLFSVHVNRIPFAGRVTGVRYRPGAFLAADAGRAALANESCATLLATAGGRQLAVVQIAGLVARRIVCWCRKGDQVERGQRFGLIRFGSRVDLYLPLQTQLAVEVGQQVRAGETLLGHLS
ncbi:MAG: phosphatidylserine decarboxylase family protein [Thermodesulfobacteriota bacterium]